MKNADMPAMPMGKTNSGGYWLKSDLDDGYAEQCNPAFGLTKREMFAMHMMSSCRVGRNYSSWNDMAKDAIGMADALLSELEQQK
jgi:hypothetical protein